MDDIRIPQRVMDGDFAGWLRDAMNDRRMSARMVGMRAGLNHSAVTRLLYGGRVPSTTTLIALLRLFVDGSPAQAGSIALRTQTPPRDLSLR